MIRFFLLTFLLSGLAYGQQNQSDLIPKAGFDLKTVESTASVNFLASADKVMAVILAKTGKYLCWAKNYYRDGGSGASSRGVTMEIRLNDIVESTVITNFPDVDGFASDFNSMSDYVVVDAVPGDEVSMYMYAETPSGIQSSERRLTCQLVFEN